MQRNKAAHDGFTLIEMMIVVAIIGILAAIAIPTYSSYVKSSKASETASILQGIREKEEAYFAEYKCYTPDIAWHPYGVGQASSAGICGSSQNWGQPDRVLPQAWIDLGFDPGGPTFYTYQVETSYNGICAFTNEDIPADTPGHPRPGSPQRPWFRVTGMGDIDCDGTPAYFYVTSYNKNIVKTRGALGTLDSTVY